MATPVKDVRFSIKGQDDSKAAWDSTTQRAEKFNSVLGTVEDRIRATSNRFAGNANVVRLNNQQLQNMSFQMNDMGVMLASGQSPFVMMMQQGMQISQIFGPGTGLQGAMRAVGTGFITFVTNPLNLAVLGIASVAGAIPLIWNAVTGPEGKDAEETLKRFDSLVKDLGKGYEDAEKAAKKYMEVAASQDEVLASVQRTKQELRTGLSSAIGELHNQTKFLNVLWQSMEPTLLRRRQEIQQLGRDLASGNITVQQFRRELASIRLAENTPASIREMVDELSDASEEAHELENRLRGVEAAAESIAGISLKSLFGSVEDFARFDPEKFDQLRSQLEAQQRELLAPMEKAKREADAERRKREAQAKRDNRKAARDLDLAKRSEIFLGDLQKEVEILGLAREERIAQLAVLKEEQAIRQAIARLGEGAGEAEIQQVRSLIQERNRLVEVNRQEVQEIQQVSQAYGEVGGAIGSAINGAISNTQNLRESLLDTLAVLIQMAIQWRTVQQFGSGSPQTSFINSLVGSLFGGFRAEGGDVDPWKTYVVGEKGPELLKMGGSGGSVVSNGDAFGGKELVFNVNVSGARGNMEIKEMVQKGVQTGIQQAAPGIVSASVSASAQNRGSHPGQWGARK